MTAPLVDRPFLTFPELVERWGGKSNDVSFALVSGALVPSYLIDGEHGQIAFVDGVPILKLAREGVQIDQLHGMHYLQRPYRTGPLDCAYTFFCAQARPSEDATWWQLSDRIELSAVLEKGAIDTEQVEAYERQHKKEPVSEEQRTLSVRERASFGKLVIGMAIDGYGFDPRDRRSQVVPEIGKALRRYGMSLEDDTVRKYLYEGVEQHLPANWHQLSS